MMKDIFSKKILPIVLIICFGYVTNAQVEVAKTITKSYPLSNTGELQLDNKYGNIHINGWDKNEILITINIQVTKKEKEDAEELLSRIKPVINPSKSFVLVQSKIEDKNNSFFSRLINNITPFDFDKGSVQIDYTVNLPVNAEVQLTNKFGDIIINEWNGKLKANLHHGDMWVNNDLVNADITSKFGKLKTKSITYGSIEIKSGDLDLEASKNLKIVSSGSTIDISKTENLELFSNKDKIAIKEVEQISGEIKFSNLTLEKVVTKINLYLNVADLQITKIQNSDANISIHQESSELNINISDTSFDFEASLEQGVLRIPKSFDNIKTNMIDKGKRIREITASYGKGEKGVFSITGKKGIITLKEL